MFGVNFYNNFLLSVKLELIQIFRDSGGAVTIVGINGQPVQIGIVSFGSKLGCEKGAVRKNSLFNFSTLNIS